MSEKFQTVGSLLRPEALLNFKHQIEHRDDITYPFYADLPGYEQCETEAVKAVVGKQIEHGLSVITDGEYTRSLWHLDFLWGLAGIRRQIAGQGYLFRDKDGCSTFETRKDIGIKITGELGGRNHHFITVYKRLQALAGDRATKFCIPSPSHIFGTLSWSDNIGRRDSVYHDAAELKAGLTTAYKDFIADYAAAGGKTIQFDDCLWEVFAADNPNSRIPAGQAGPEKARALAEEFIGLNNAIISYGHDLGLKVWTHNCRGNYSSRHMSAGSYEKIADLFLKQQNYDRFFLEWDDERAGSISALSAFAAKPDTEIVLGLLSSKTNTLDDEARAFRLLDEASAIIPKDKLYLSHQCGFASCDCGNELTEDEQWAKIDQGQRIAKEYWGK